MRQAFFEKIVLFGGLIVLAACNSSSSTPPVTTPPVAPQVIATAWTAELIGELVEVDGCLRVNDRDSQTSYLLAWPPDLAATIEKDTVRVVSGIVTGNRQEVVLHVGEMVRLSGGETENLNEQLRQTLPASCAGPYWVVGIEVGPLTPAQESK